jgi:hypothetical protein
LLTGFVLVCSHLIIKTFLPFVEIDGELVCKGFPKPHPLYGLDRLAARPDAIGVVTEGEATADAAAALFPDYVCVTSPHGSKAAASADWSPLAGRTVVIWPDHDAAGIGYAMDVAKLVMGAKVVPVPADFPARWDVADDMPEGVTEEVLAGLLHRAEEPQAPQSKKRKTKDDLHKSVEELKRDRDDMLAKIRALRGKTTANGCTEEEAASAAAKVKALMAEYKIDELELDIDIEMSDVEPDDFVLRVSNHDLSEGEVGRRGRGQARSSLTARLSCRILLPSLLACPCRRNRSADHSLTTCASGGWLRFCRN